LSVFETFGQFTATLKLPWTPGRFFVPSRSVVCNKTLRLGRKWLESGESRIFWLDDAEHVGIRLRALQLNELELEYTMGEDENSWEVNVEGETSPCLCSICDRVLMICSIEIICRVVPFLVDIERAQAMKTSQTIVHLRA
jgi:hypothetical protein